MTEEALVDMLLPVKIDPIDRGLPTDVDKARIAAKLREPGCADDAAAFYDAVAISLHSALDFEDADVGAQEMLEMLADLLDPVGPVVECRLCGERAAKADGKVELREDGLLVGVQPRYRCGACGGSWREGWA